MEKIVRDKLAVKIVCVALAAILWLYVSYQENPTMTKTVRNVPLAISGEQALKESGFSVYSISEKSVDVDSELIIKLLSLVKSETIEDFNTSKFISCIQGLKAKRPQLKCKIIVRLDRDVAKGTGTLLSPNDRLLGDTFKNEVVLTMYRVLGNQEKGWDGHPLWIPNIKFPEDCCFYDVEEIARG